MTAQQWLDLPKDERALEFGRALRLGPWKHGKMVRESGGPRHERFTGLCSLDVCPKCDKDWEWCEVHPCSDPDPIDIKGRTGAITLIRKMFITPKAQSDYVTELVDICDKAPIDYLDSEPDFMLWLLFVADVKDLLIAAAMATERSKE